MPAVAAPPPNWLLPARYEHLREMDERAFAWEIVRRNPGYRLQAATGRCTLVEASQPISVSREETARAGAWGLLFFRESGR